MLQIWWVCEATEDYKPAVTADIESGSGLEWKSHPKIEDFKCLTYSKPLKKIDCLNGGK